ncbi:salivary peroxidase/catechol oxidase-like [Mytilus edulis]|uniref:salivary peroxidase/catechol oxidase-like n=1 Tax=Mytilus edulis TaxID=6550 RepID=UPI0039EE9DD7
MAISKLLILVALACVGADDIVCDVDAKYRTIDGSCNNLKNGKGASNTFFKRLPDENENNVIDYADGIGLPRAAKNGDELPNARLVSQAIIDEKLGPLIQRDRTRSAQNDTDLPPGCINFVRATGKLDEEGVRQQTNLATAFVDASVVYGSTPELTNILRVPDSCDSRVAEVPMLSVQHLAWHREHNRIASELRTLNPHWKDETVFQEARKIVIAIFQHITFNDFLPLILGKAAMKRFKLFSRDVNEGVFSDPYDVDMNPQVLGSVNVAAHRFGHSQVTNEQNFVDEDCNTVTVNKLEDVFDSPRLIQQNCGVNIPFIGRNLACTASNRVDNFFVDAMRNRLYRKSESPGSDIVARNIQRGRDFGVAGYNRWRELCLLEAIKSFDSFEKFGKALKELYNDIDDIDLFVGGLLEQEMGFNVGPTFQCLLGFQYERMKQGDRFWYERPNQMFSFTEKQLRSIKENASVSKIFCRNLGIEKIQENIFLLHQSKRNKGVACNDIPDIDLTLWQEHY